MAVHKLNLGLAAPADGCGGDSCACAAPTDAAYGDAAGRAASGREIGVVGMTCDHCVRAVTEEISALDGVTAVRVELVAGGTSRVRVDGDASDDELRAAVTEAGYSLVG
ncbi:heavy-metal-associated domain-containing protein [Microbacterium sp. RD1]|uniref:heavy-metal-associated domain-containing protein n=1 Tax=Microbacterium sp. RD1 TaxID=3457313 RepID=UPI003FA589BA